MPRLRSTALPLLLFSALVSVVYSVRELHEERGPEALWPAAPPLLQRSPRSPSTSPPPPPPPPAQAKTAPQGSPGGSGASQRAHGPPSCHDAGHCTGPGHGHDHLEPSLTCQAHCPRCPPPAPAPACPSPCAACPPHACPAPCKACPACPACKARVPPGYEHFPGVGTYRLHNVPSDWFEAKAACERDGAHLAIINSQAEADIMKKLFHRDLSIGILIYLGFHDLYKEGTYVTIFGEPLSATGYTKWDSGQPDNNGKNENCGSMFPSGGLNDMNCGSKQPFVCEYPA